MNRLGGLVGALRKLLLLVAGVAVAFGLGEAAVRLLRMAPLVTALKIDTPNGEYERVDDPALVYVPRAGVHEINSYGIRDRSYSIEKPPGTYRIVVIGDSVTFGMCSQQTSVPLAQTFVKWLEVLLNEKKPEGIKEVEVINLGVPGYDTLNEAKFFQMKGAALSPDLVIVAYVLNDVFESSDELAQFRRDANWHEPDSSRVYHAIFERSHLVRFVWQRVNMLKASSADDSYRGGGRFSTMPRTDHVTRGFDAIGQMAETGHFKVLTAVFPVFYGDDWQKRADIFEHYSRAKEHELPKLQASAHGFLHIDLLDAFKKAAAGNALSLQGDCDAEHPNAAGHAVAANALAAFISNNKLVRPWCAALRRACR